MHAIKQGALFRCFRNIEMESAGALDFEPNCWINNCVLTKRFRDCIIIHIINATSQADTDLRQGDK